MKANVRLYYSMPKFVEHPKYVLFGNNKYILTEIDDKKDGVKTCTYVCEIIIPTQPMENLQEALYNG